MEMHLKRLPLIAILVLPLILLALLAPYAYAFSIGQAASLVIGQTSFTSGSFGTTAVKLDRPLRGLAIEDGKGFTQPVTEGSLWVADSFNNRVLMYKAPFSTGEAASLVIGQTSFTSGTPGDTATTLNTPDGVAFDASGNLWVADYGNNRVLMYKPPFSTGEAASFVIGQPSFTTKICATTATRLCEPSGIAFDASGNLWIADIMNNRVLMYAPPFIMASLVIGQASFTTFACATTLTGLCGPLEVAFDASGNLWVTDFFNNRVLMYMPPFSNGEPASLVIGQGSFTTAIAGTSAKRLREPEGVAFDGKGNLWVADSDNNRVLMYSPPFSTFEAASLVIGQGSFTTGTAGTTATALHFPTVVAFDGLGNLWVADALNSRLLMYS
jgi:sugar lactone lactonase YvrE